VAVALLAVVVAVSLLVTISPVPVLAAAPVRSLAVVGRHGPRALGVLLVLGVGVFVVFIVLPAAVLLATAATVFLVVVGPGTVTPVAT
jgi:hypothetical protein